VLLLGTGATSSGRVHCGDGAGHGFSTSTPEIFLALTDTQRPPVPSSRDSAASARRRGTTARRCPSTQMRQEDLPVTGSGRRPQQVTRYRVVHHRAVCASNVGPAPGGPAWGPHKHPGAELRGPTTCAPDLCVPKAPICARPPTALKEVAHTASASTAPPSAGPRQPQAHRHREPDRYHRRVVRRLIADPSFATLRRAIRPARRPRTRTGPVR
jgi:hypothetical protein